MKGGRPGEEEIVVRRGRKFGGKLRAAVNILGVGGGEGGREREATDSPVFFSLFI